MWNITSKRFLPYLLDVATILVSHLELQPGSSPETCWRKFLLPLSRMEKFAGLLLQFWNKCCCFQFLVTLSIYIFKTINMYFVLFITNNLIFKFIWKCSQKFTTFSSLFFWLKRNFKRISLMLTSCISNKILFR